MVERAAIPVILACAMGCVRADAQPFLWSVRYGATLAQPAAELPAEYRTLLEVCDDAAAARETRDAAAARLVAASDPALQSIVADRISSGGSASAPLLLAIGRVSTPRAELFDPVRAYVNSATEDRLPPGLTALGGFRTPEAAALLLTFTGVERASTVRGSAFRALGRLSGRDDLAEDRGAWAAWYENAKGLGRDEWNTLILAGLARRSDRLAAEQARAGARLVDAFRRLYLVVSGATSEDRPRLLVSLLQDDREELRFLGFELVAREVSSGAVVDPAVGAAVIRLLGHGSAAVRAQAASVVSQAAPAGAGEAVSAALIKETDPVAAAGLLVAAARWPTASMLEPAERWATNGSETRLAAVQLLLSMARAGQVADGQLPGVCRAFREQDPFDLSPPEIKLLAAVGGEEGRQWASRALQAPGPARRLAAAESLSERAGFVPAILAAARSDPALFESAARAVATHQPDSDGLQALLALPSPSPAARAGGVSLAAEAAPLEEVLEVARALVNPEDRELLLGFLMQPRPGPTGQDPGTVAQAYMLLARARLDTGRPDAALSVLAAIPPSPAVPSATVRDLRTVALLWTGRIDDAEALDAPASAWLDGLEHALAQPHARRLAEAITQRFADSMTEAERTRLAELAERAQAAVHETPAPPP